MPSRDSRDSSSGSRVGQAAAVTPAVPLSAALETDQLPGDVDGRCPDVLAVEVVVAQQRQVVRTGEEVAVDTAGEQQLLVGALGRPPAPRRARRCGRPAAGWSGGGR